MPPQPSFSDALHGPSSWENSLQAPPLKSSGDSSEADHDSAPRSGENYQVWLQDDDRDAQDASRKRSQQETARSKKKRKSTYDIRREQKVELTDQVETLQKQLEKLKYRVLVEQGEAAKSNARTAAGNAVLQEFIQHQHVELANMQALLAGHLQQNVETLHPAQSIIRLGTDRVERHNVLVALKDKKLQEAKRFITARSHGLDPNSTYTQEERNQSPGGHFCLVIFENRVIHGASARAIFESFIDIAQNAEIVISEMFGSITIRENNEADTRDISQMRLVSSTSQGTFVESNTVMFSEFVDAKDDNDESCGVIVSDFVDSDELYPYKPEERARRDTTTVFMVRSFKKPPGSKSGGKANENSNTSDDNERVVVATRWTSSKIRRSKMNLSADVLREMQESTVSFGDTMKKCIQQRLGKTGMYDPKPSARSKPQ
ncbi:hypothetical protein PHYPSEUDO_014776 [Phytophthora pseudosyringae]|uniref:Uncharacterized protein n=1 Tax=Phytophthora pseudosyringae TaxID=221518 RepID=A0A8T1V4V5_9STRA|nr:hypothetical protein PHYPSEUDO_014776 [Phytophthora pseudosyringae]